MWCFFIADHANSRSKASPAAVWRMVWKCTKLGTGRQFGTTKIRKNSDCGKEKRAKPTVESMRMDEWLDLESCEKKEEKLEKQWRISSPICRLVIPKYTSLVGTSLQASRVSYPNAKSAPLGFSTPTLMNI